MLRFLYFLSVILAVNSGSAPFIKPCGKKDLACVKTSAQAAVPFIAPGNPELGVPSLDPLRLPRIKGDQNGLKLTFKNTIINGMKNCVINDVTQDLDKGKQGMEIQCTVNMKGDYKLGGQLLILPIRGDGKYTIKIQDIVIRADIDLKTVEGVDGKPHWHITDWTHSYDVKTSAHFDFKNLFGGNALLAGPVLEFVNFNWREVMQEVAPPVVKGIVQAVVDAVQAFYTSVPADELYINN
ncbi:hypothetical protein ACJJTC_007314 [Scirpophaga incertulas]